jgi:HK97 family phage major capsid protein
VPVVEGDAAAAWVPEGGDITPSDAAFDELVVRPQKVAGLSIISRELAEDSAPSAQQLVGESLAQSIANAVDQAFFGNAVTNGPNGLLSVTGVSVVDTAGTIANTDPPSVANLYSDKCSVKSCSGRCAIALRIFCSETSDRR